MLLLGSVASGAEPDPSSWPQFRGPSGGGIGFGSKVPLTWSKTDNVAWSREIPGQAWSSPIVVGDWLFLASAVSRSSTKQPGRGIYGNDWIAELIEQGFSEEEAAAKTLARDIEKSAELEEAVSWYVFGLDAKTGETVWQRRAHRGSPPGGRHRKNTWASETAASDGERVYFLFGNIGLFAYSLEGQLEWQVAFEPHEIYLDFGTGSSPIVDDKNVYVVRDNEEVSTLTAYDREDGSVRWTTERHRGKRGSGWATPFLWTHEQRSELVTVGTGRVLSYAPSDGELLWSLAGVRGVAAPTPFAAGGRLFISSGGPEEPQRPLFAVLPGAAGELSLADDPGPESVAWIATRGGSYIPTPIVLDDILYVLYDKGFLAAYDVSTGERHYRVRIARDGGSFTSSPWAWGEHLFLLNEDGETFVVAAGTEFRLLERNDLDETCMATPALAHDSHYIRTQRRLYRITAAESPPPETTNGRPARSSEGSDEQASRPSENS